MATRTEQFRASEERKHHEPKRKNKEGSKPGSPEELRRRARKHAGKKATYALEEQPEGQRPSRKSSRKSANRAKPDTDLILREALVKGTPEERFRKAKARKTRVRGNSAGEPSS